MEKELSNLHKELLRIKSFLLQTELGKTADSIAREMGIDIDNEKWDLSPDMSKFIKHESPKAE